MEEFAKKRIVLPNTRLGMEVIEKGKGPLLVLLHGFPEMAESWRRQISHFSQKGYKVVAPNLRGYGNTDRPAVGYDIDTLADDVAGIFEHYGEKSGVLAGHDWGGVIAWHAALRHPDRIRALVIMNAPHMGRYLKLLGKGSFQWLKSWYVYSFQIPRFPEWVMGRKHASVVGWLIDKTAVNKAAFTKEDIDRYRGNMADPGALWAGLAYYRQLFRRLPFVAKFQSSNTIQAPTLVVWGMRDVYLVPELTQGLDAFCQTPPKVVLLPEFGHWVQQEAPEQVNQAMEDFLANLD